jgi:putative endonuclease
MPYVYILRCRDGSLYTGVTTDLARRLAEHAAGRGARYTRGRRPVALAWRRRATSWSQALKEEYRIKRLPRAEKLALVAGPPRARRSGGKAT